MAMTKILNIQKNDSVEEVLEAFRSADAQEVIFIFPKGTVFGKEASHFDAIKEEAEESGKTVSIMTSDPVIAHLAEQHGLGLLEKPGKAKKEVSIAPQKLETLAVTDVEEQIEKQEEELESEEREDEDLEDVAQSDANTQGSPAFLRAEKAFAPINNNVYADLAVARKKIPGRQVLAGDQTRGRKIKDIHISDEDHPVEVSGEEGDEVEVPLSRASVIPPQKKAYANMPEKEVVETTNESNEVDIESLWRQEEARQGGDDLEGSDTKDGKKKFKIFGKLSKKFIFIPLAILVFAVLTTVYFTVGNATVTVTPKSQDIDLEFDITASVDQIEIDEKFKSIPGQFFDIVKTESGSYPTTVEKEVAQKASGNIVISNTSNASQRLVATTRFESKDGLIFRIPETITVPAGTASKPGTIEVKVYADRAGKEYNIAPTTFKIPGFKDSPRYEQFSAESKEAMSGGTIGKAKVVSESDVAKANEELRNSVKEQVEFALVNETGGLKIIGSPELVIDDPKINAKAGEAADSLEMSISASTKVMGFLEEDVRELITRYISENGALVLVEDGLKISYELKAIDIAKKKMTFMVKIQGKAAVLLDKVNISNSIRGMNSKALNDYFHNQEGVETANIVFWPRWVMRVPHGADDLKLIVDMNP